jgi:hypothetical protein
MKYSIVTIAGAAALLTAGCNTTPSSQPSGSVNSSGTSTSYSPPGGSSTAPGLSISAFNKDVMAGDTTTLVVSDRNTLGRNAHVEWMTTGGRIMPAENGRVARATFDAPGDYTVTAGLFFGNVEVARDSVNISARPLR